MREKHFLKCLNGLEKIDGGEILFENTNLNTPATNWNQMRQKIGMVFQNYELFPHLNVLDNILLAPLRVQKRSKDEVISQAVELLKRVGLEHKQQAYPKELSGGQKQRVAIVRLFMHAAKNHALWWSNRLFRPWNG